MADPSDPLPAAAGPTETHDTNKATDATDLPAGASTIGAAPAALSHALSSLLDDLARQENPAGALYVVATPIGNAADITLRSLNILALADAVACEDTRNTGHLLTRYGLQKTLIAAHQHNEREVAARLIERLQAGQRIALVSDAGTPAVSDPGARIVDAVRTAGLPVIPLPGPSAAIAALSASGLCDAHFHFVGFLPSRAAQRDAMLQPLKSLTATLILYEAPHRIRETVAALEAQFEAGRQIVFARELTKRFEEIHRCSMAEAGAWLDAGAHREKGEYVLLVAGATAAADAGQEEAERVLRILMAACPLKQAAALAAQITGQKKNGLYARALALRGEAGIAEVGGTAGSGDSAAGGDDGDED